VATLVAAAGQPCGGMGYCISEGVFEHLDHREKNGYQRVDTAMALVDGRHVEATVYIADADNHAFLGPDSLPLIAEQIRASHGPSGANRDYLLELASALRDLEIEDEHVFALEALLREPAG